jgi:Flp pilus assembly protein TadG
MIPRVPGSQQDLINMAKAGSTSFLTALLRRFRSDKRGNIAITFTLALLPILSAIGAVTDYSMASRMRAKMQSAADAAAVASISKNSAGYLAATTMTGDGSIANGLSDANNLFCGNLNVANANPGTVGCNAPASSGFGNLSMAGTTVTKTGLVLNSVVNFSATVPVTFMKVLGYQNIGISGTSKATSSLPPYLDFYLALDVSGSMGLPSTTQEAQRLQLVNPDNFVQYPTGCTLACHFAPLKSACVDPPVTAPAAPPANPPITTTSYTQRYNTNNACMGYAYSRVSQTALKALIARPTSGLYPKQVPGLPVQMLSGLPGSLNTDPNFGMAAATSCPTAGADGCIQLRLDAVSFALNATLAANGVDGLLALAQKKEVVANQFRIGLYPFITDIDKNYSPLTTSITGSAITTAAAGLAAELDTNLNSALGSGGTHIDNALHSINGLITSVGTGSSSINTLPYIFLVTDGAQDNQYKDVPNGSWHGSNHATLISDSDNTYPNICTTLKNRGIIVSVLYIPYQTISPVNTSFAGDEDDYANANIGALTPPGPGIATSLSNCASPPDASGSYFYTASTPQQISDSLNAMFNHTIQVAHITN